MKQTVSRTKILTICAFMSMDDGGHDFWCNSSITNTRHNRCQWNCINSKGKSYSSHLMNNSSWFFQTNSFTINSNNTVGIVCISVIYIMLAAEEFVDERCRVIQLQTGKSCNKGSNLWAKTKLYLQKQGPK